MAIRLTKPWQPLNEETVRPLQAQLGVYEIADADGTVLFIGFAGGRALFGLRGKLLEEIEKARPAAAQFRVEVNQQYWSRQHELLMAYQADHGDLPRDNAAGEARPNVLGRLSPA